MVMFIFYELFNYLIDRVKLRLGGNKKLICKFIEYLKLEFISVGSMLLRV